MKALIIIGIILGASTITTDLFIKPIPNRLAIALYAIAVVLIVAGMIAKRTVD